MGIMDQHKTENDNVNQWKPTRKGHKARESMKIGDIVDENGIDFDDEYEQQSERQSNDEKEEEEQMAKPKRTSRESRQLNDNELPSVDEDSDSEQEMKETKRVKKNKKSRESRQIDENEWVDPNELSQPKRKEKSRSSRESRQIENSDLGYQDEEPEEEYEIVEDEQKPTKKARGSVQMDAPVLSMDALETHNEHHLEDVAAEYNGPKDSAPTHKKSDTITSNSTAYREYMTPD